MTREKSQANMENTVENILKIKIENTDVFLENFDIGQGKITISDTYGHNYSNYWGAMSDTIQNFLLRIDSDYFANKLIPASDENVIDIKSTFKTLRNHIRTELDMPFYREMEFQKDLREKINEFQTQCSERGGKYYFVDRFFTDFVNSLDFYLIKDTYERKQIKDAFEGIQEQWYFLEEKRSENYNWLLKFHGKLKNELKKSNK